MPLSRDDYKTAIEAMATIVRAGAAADKLGDALRWQRLSSAELRMKHVLSRVGTAGWWAQDVLDMMEENNE